MGVVARTLHEVGAAVHGEHDAPSGPNSLLWARLSRWVCALLLVIAGASLLVTKLGASAMVKHEELLTFVDFLFRAGVCLLHLYYLQLVLNILVFHVPIQSFQFRTLLIPFLLVVAYLTGIYEVLGSSHGPFPQFGAEAKERVKFVSIMSFISVYYFWCIRDMAEASVRHGESKRVRAVWASFDFGVFIVLTCFAIQMADISKEFWGPLSIKDLCILACVGLYEAFHRVSWMVERDHYVSEYQRYLSCQQIEQVEVAPKIFERVVTCSGKSPVATAVGWLQSNPNPLVVDFGCADSRRLAWFLRELRTAGHPNGSEVVRFDIRRGWAIQDLLFRHDSDLLLNQNAKPEFIVHLNDLAAKLKGRPCLIHASHVLYDRSAVMHLERLLNSVKTPVCVVIRGYGESIFRQVSVFQALTNARSSNISHLWDSVYLPYLVERCRLLPKKNEPWNGGDVLQRMTNDDIEFDCLEQFLRVLYGPSWTEMSQVFLRETWENTRGPFVPNPDVIYCFTRNA